MAFKVWAFLAVALQTVAFLAVALLAVALQAVEFQAVAFLALAANRASALFYSGKPSWTKILETSFSKARYYHRILEWIKLSANTFTGMPKNMGQLIVSVDRDERASALYD